MKNFKLSTSKLAAYSMLATGFIAGKEAEAQIIYTDIDPDSLVGGSFGSPPIAIDLNNDGRTDISISDYYDTAGYYFVVKAKVMAGVQMGVYHHSYNLAVALDYGVKISNSLGTSSGYWSRAGYIQVGRLGAWKGQGEHYLPIRINERNGNYQYGWIRMIVSPKGSRLIVKDYACNSFFNQSILAGQTSPCGDGFEINNSFARAKEISSGYIYHGLINTAGDLDYFRFNANKSNVRVSLFNLPENYNLKMFDSNQHLVASSSNSGTKSDTIIYNNIPAGDYYIEVLGKNNFDPDNCYALKVETSNSPFSPTTNKSQSSNASAGKNVTIFPNPAKSELWVSLRSAEDGKIEFQVFDLSGKSVLETQYESPAEGINTLHLQLPDLSNGSYLLQVKNGETIDREKLLIQK